MLDKGLFKRRPEGVAMMAVIRRESPVASVL
ncbi:MAG: hypothetical protein JWO15_3506 [Sphingomonadales bacterium]|jgi:hypothetical protein|nr:hypothetical protein [Sphingomonadales bacterium]